MSAYGRRRRSESSARLRTIVCSHALSAISRVVAAQRAVGADERLLDDVLGVVVGAAEDPPRVGEQPRLVAGDELRVGVRIAAAHALDELLVGDREVEDLSHGRRFGPRGPRSQPPWAWTSHTL